MEANLKNLKRDEFLANEAHYIQQLKNVENWRHIPILNYTPLCTIKNGYLMRFRGIIQDMLQNETYLSRYEIINELTNERRLVNGKYQDDIHMGDDENVDYNGEQNEYCDRKLLYVTSVPGYNYWAAEFESKLNNAINNPPRNNVVHVNRAKKRPLPDDNDHEEPNKRSNAETKEEPIKRACTTPIANNDLNSAESAQSSFHFYSTEKKLPLNPACIIKLYSDFNNFPLNTYVEALGFVAFKDPNDKYNENQFIDPEIDFFEETLAKAFPGPEMHTIIIRSISSLNPTLDIGLTPIDNAFENRLRIIFDNLHVTLTQCLLGDKIAAQYLLGHIISTIYVRTETQTLGQFSVNISNIPNHKICPGYTTSLYELLEMILPASSYLPVTLDNMNSLPIVPKKDYRISKLVTGILQLADHTQLVLDETVLQSGNLNENGVKAVHHLNDLIVRQNIYYDFEYYKIAFVTNIPTLILSEGRSMLPANCHIPLKYDPDCIPVILETLKAAKHYIQPKLFEIRQYITNCTKTDFIIQHDISRIIEDDFVQLRKSDESIGSEYLHTLLVLSRLMGIATGNSCLRNETWQMAKDMEFERRLRLSSISAPK